MSGLRLHPRTRIVQQAKIDLSEAVMGVVTKHDLTFGEILGLLADAGTTYARWLVRTERHNDADKKGDEA